MRKRKPYYWVLLIVWLSLCVYALFSYWSHPAAGKDAEVAELLTLEMLVLTFPLGYVAGVLAGNNAVLMWLAMTATGYLQWFILLPRLFAWGRLFSEKSDS